LGLLEMGVLKAAMQQFAPGRQIREVFMMRRFESLSTAIGAAIYSADRERPDDQGSS